MRRRAIVGGALVAGGTVHHMNKKYAEREAEADQQAQIDYQQEQINQQQAALEAQAAQQRAVPAPSGGLGGSSVDELTRLAQLHQQGILTDAEFAAAKAKVLG